MKKDEKKEEVDSYKDAFWWQNCLSDGAEIGCGKKVCQCTSISIRG
jgi:hypothetical protein